jgi:ribosomal-protein-alanine N-acetyltransferase
MRDPPRSATFPALETPRLVLRELRPDDAAAAFAFYADPDVVRYYDSPLARVEQARQEIAHHRRRFETGEAIRWGIVVKGEGRVAGTCGYLARDTACRHAMLSYVLARRHWNKGLMTEALGAVVRFGFERYGLHRIEAQVAVPNRASLRVLQKLGFRQEGLLRERFFVDGRFHDEAMLSLLEGDFVAREQHSPAAQR